MSANFLNTAVGVSTSDLLDHKSGILLSQVVTQKKTPKYVFKTDNRLMRVKSIAECSHSAILFTCTKLPPVFKTFVLPIFEWPLKTGFTVTENRYSDKLNRL